MVGSVFASPQRIDPDELGRLVSKLGGDWESEAQRGVLEVGEAAIYVDFYDSIAGEMSEGELARFRELFGTNPASAISVDASHTVGSIELANSFIAKLDEVWRGALGEELLAPGSRRLR